MITFGVIVAAVVVTATGLLMVIFLWAGKGMRQLEEDEDAGRK